MEIEEMTGVCKLTNEVSAETACAITMSAIQTQAEERLNEIYRKIRQYAKRGSTTLSLKLYEARDEERKKLVELGFNITLSKSMITICWNNKIIQ